MKPYQARGYYLEEIVRELMRKSKFVDIKTGNIEGRGADHQIDSYGRFMFTIPFVYPVRLISEVKWFSKKYTVMHAMAARKTPVTGSLEGYHPH